MDVEMKPAVTPETSFTTSLSVALTFKTMARHYLASEHLWAAMESARRCRDLERTLKSVGGPATHVTHRAHAVSAVMSSVAFLEALVNEVFEDAAQGASSRVEPLSQQCRDLMKEYWATAERTNLLSKYQMGLLFAGAEKMDRGGAPMQDAALLVALRNALIHFRPSWHDAEDPTNLERRLSAKFGKSELLPENDGSPWSVWALAAAGATWSEVTARTFADEWMDRMRLTRSYETDLVGFEAQVAGGRVGPR